MVKINKLALIHFVIVWIEILHDEHDGRSLFPCNRLSVNGVGVFIVLVLEIGF